MRSMISRSRESRRRDAGIATQDSDSRQIARRLSREFSAPVGAIANFDIDQGEWCQATGREFPELKQLLTAASESEALRSRRVAIWHPDKDCGRVWLLLLMVDLEGTETVFVAPFCTETGWNSLLNGPVQHESHTETLVAPRGPHCPEPALIAWGEQALTRFQVPGGNAGVGSTSPESIQTGENIVIGRLIRRMRISDPPRRFQSLATNVVRASLNVQAVAWVPVDVMDAVVVSGEIPGVETSEFRLLTAHSTKDSSLVGNATGSGRTREPLASFRQFAVVMGGGAGWLVAANPEDHRQLDSAEVEIIQYAASLIDTQLNNAKIYAELKELLFGIIRALTAAIDAKDPYTCGHSERVARIAVRLAEELGVPPQKRSDLYLTGLLHDVGKIGIDDEVLKKSGPLSPEEYRRIQSHVEIGVTILSDLRKLHHILPGVRHHHESHDGTGYPDKLAGEEIPLEARILAVADSFDAMSSNRPYRRRLSQLQIDEILKKGRGIQWDPQVIDALFSCRMDLEAIRQKGLGESLQGAVDVALGRR